MGLGWAWGGLRVGFPGVNGANHHLMLTPRLDNPTLF